MKLDEALFSLKDSRYAEFQSKLIPEISKDTILGIRVPALRKLAKTYSGSVEAEAFLKRLPHGLYDENMLHSLLVSEIGDYGVCIKAVDTFLPYVDNWAVCDILSPKVFRKNRDTLLPEIRKWVASPKPYTCRFGMEMLLTHFLDDSFRPEYLGIPASVHSDEYYVNMMTAWFFATALAKQWNDTIPYLERGLLDMRVHNKTIQKALESYRITAEQKEYLRTLKNKTPHQVKNQ